MSSPNTDRNSNSASQRQKGSTTHMFTKANGITINSGTYTNVGGAVYNVKGDPNSANNKRRFQQFQAGIQRTTGQYGGNVEVSAFEGLRDTTINGNNASVTNSGGGVFDVDLTRSSGIEQSSDEQNGQSKLGPPTASCANAGDVIDPDDNPAQSTTRVTNQTKYHASIFRGAKMGNMNLTGDVVNTALGYYSGDHGMSPESIQKLQEGILETNSMYAGEMTAKMFENATSTNVTIGNVTNVAGASFGGFSRRR